MGKSIGGQRSCSTLQLVCSLFLTPQIDRASPFSLLFLFFSLISCHLGTLFQQSCQYMNAFKFLKLVFPSWSLAQFQLVFGGTVVNMCVVRSSSKCAFSPLSLSLSWLSLQLLFYGVFSPSQLDVQSKSCNHFSKVEKHNMLGQWSTASLTSSKPAVSHQQLSGVSPWLRSDPGSQQSLSYFSADLVKPCLSGCCCMLCPRLSDGWTPKCFTAHLPMQIITFAPSSTCLNLCVYMWVCVLQPRSEDVFDLSSL